MSVLQRELNRLANAGVPRDPSACVGPNLAANQYAGTTGLDMVGALNTKAGNARANWIDLQGVLNQLAGTTGLGVDGAAMAITAVGTGGTITPTVVGVSAAVQTATIKTTPIVRGAQATGTTSGVGSIACPLPVTANAGDLILLAGVSRGGTTFATPSGYTLKELFNGTNKDLVSFYKVAAGGETTVTFDPANTQAMTGHVIVIQAGTFNAGSIFDGTAVSAEQSTGNNANLVSTTTTTVNCLALSFVAELKADTTSIAFTQSGWTSQTAQFSHNGTNGHHSVLYSRPIDAAAATPATTITSSPTTSSTWMSQTLAVKAA